MRTASMCKAITAAGIAGLMTYAICKANSRQKRKLKCKATKLLRSCKGVANTMSSMLDNCC